VHSLRTTRQPKTTLTTATATATATALPLNPVPRIHRLAPGLDLGLEPMRLDHQALLFGVLAQPRHHRRMGTPFWAQIVRPGLFGAQHEIGGVRSVRRIRSHAGLPNPPAVRHSPLIIIDGVAMFTRRALLASLIAATLAPAAVAQGKKGGPANTMDSIIGIDGDYRSNGRNADGSAYSGNVVVVQQGDAVEFTWTISTDTYRGAGLIEGRIVTVDWGAATPVIYVAMPNGELHGTWDNGAALEKLTPR